jgi:acyl dehydratase
VPCNSAFLYRLNGDRNPLHVDVDRAKVGGFDKPILHGMCSFGITARIIYETYCLRDPSMFKKMAARFTSVVYPGDTFLV